MQWWEGVPRVSGTVTSLIVISVVILAITNQSVYDYILGNTGND